MTTNILFAVLAVSLVLAVQANVYMDPDLPSTNPNGAVPHIETIKGCSLVLPADNSQQSTNGVFNQRVHNRGICTYWVDMYSLFLVKAMRVHSIPAPASCGRAVVCIPTKFSCRFDAITWYGLVNKLLWANIPVKWIIKTGKQQDEVDFTGSVWKIFPQNETASPPVTRQFSGGPWVVPVEYAQYALPIIQAFGSNVNVYKLSEPTTADVRYTLNKKPFVAVLDSSGFNEIQIGYLLSAGFENGTHFQVMSKEQANSFDSGVCVSLATEPHFESVTSAAEAETFVSAMRAFVNSGGNFLAECGGVRTYENCHSGYGTSYYGTQEPVCPSGFFLTERGLNTQKSSSAYTDMPTPSGKNSAVFNVAPDAPLMQISGTWKTTGGSVTYFAEYGADPNTYQVYSGSDSSQFISPLRPGSYWAVKDGTTDSSIFNETYVAMGGKTILGRVGSNVFYYAGHQYSTSNEPNGVRFYLNAVLIPAERAQSCGFQVDQCAFGSCIFVKKRSVTGEEVVEQVLDTSLTPCGCNVVYDCDGVCGGNNTAGGCQPPPMAPPPVRPPLAPPPPSAPAPKSAPLAPPPVVLNSPSSGDNGGTPSSSSSPSTGGNSAPSSTVSGLPPSTIPITSGPKGGNTLIEQVGPSNPRTFVLVVGEDIRTIQVFVEVLNWDPQVKVSVYLAKGRIPTVDDSDCKWENINKLDFDYADEVENLAASRPSACAALDSLPGEWVVVVESTQTIGFAFEGYIEPAHGVVKELVVEIGSSSFTSPSLIVALLAMLMVVACL